jgi:bifunctional NMN adenylyltransferase/nudix hydrolase
MQRRKLYRLALCSGRYQHIHKIHEFMIDTGLYLAEKVILFIGEPNEKRTINNPFSFQERRKLIELIYWKEVNIDENLVICPLTEIKELGLKLNDWCNYACSTAENIIGIKPDIIIEGPDKRVMNFFKPGDMNNISEFIVSENIWNGKENLNIRGTKVREFLKNDDWNSWSKCVNPLIYDQYNRLQKIILECK